MNAPSNTFPQLLLVAGLTAVVRSWDDNGNIQFRDDATQDQRQRVLEIWTRRGDPTFSPAIRAQKIDEIAKIESANPITQRALREFMLSVAVALNAPMTTPGLAKAKEINDQIATLRGQM